MLLSVIYIDSAAVVNIYSQAGAYGRIRTLVSEHRKEVTALIYHIRIRCEFIKTELFLSRLNNGFYAQGFRNKRHLFPETL